MLCFNCVWWRLCRTNQWKELLLPFPPGSRLACWSLNIEASFQPENNKLWLILSVNRLLFLGVKTLSVKWIGVSQKIEVTVTWGWVRWEKFHFWVNYAFKWMSFPAPSLFLWLCLVVSSHVVTQFPWGLILWSNGSHCLTLSLSLALSIIKERIIIHGANFDTSKHLQKHRFLGRHHCWLSKCCS